MQVHRDPMIAHSLTCISAINCDPQMHGRPLATRPIREDDYLPLESYDLDRNAEEMMEPKYRYFVSAPSLPRLGSFGREAQATFLFDRARIAIECGDGIANNLYHIARDLQNLLAVVMEQIGGRWGIYSGATQMLIMYGIPLFHFLNANQILKRIV